MQEGQSWRDGALAMLRPMTGGVVESSEGGEIERERETVGARATPSRGEPDRAEIQTKRAKGEKK